jgi:methyltransferase family protein
VRGRKLRQVADAETSSAVLMRLINGYQVSQAIHVAAALGIADKLADGPRAVGELASMTGTHAGSLHRLLRALAAVEVVREEDDGTFGSTDLGEALRGPAGSWAAFIGEPSHWTAWGATAAQRAHR